MTEPGGGTVKPMSAIRALAEDLISRSDNELRSFLLARPDLALPPVPDFPALAARASTRVSVQRALEQLTEPEIDALHTIELTTSEESQLSTTASWLKPYIGGSTVKSLDAILDRLHSLALIRRAPAHPGTPASDHRRRFYLPVPSLQEALGPYPAGLGRPYASLVVASPEFGQKLVRVVAKLRSRGFTLEEADSPETAAFAMQHWVCQPDSWTAVSESAPAGTMELLHRFTSSPVGTLPRGESMATIQWLLETGLLAPVDADHVELPRAVGQAARGHLIISRLRLDPPVPDLPETTAVRRDNAAHSAVAETLRLVTDLLHMVHGGAVTTLRSGGVGVREVRRLSEKLRIPPAETAWLLELAAMASLIELNVDTSRWIAAPDTNWQELDRSRQWERLVRGWLTSPRAPSLFGTAVPAGGTVNALAAEASRPDAPHVRQRLLATLSELDSLCSSDDGPAILHSAAVVDRLSWYQPRLHRRFARLVPGMLLEASYLGLLGSSALTELGRQVQAENFDGAAATLANELPDALSHFMLQADLTAIAPGYLDPEVARFLALVSTPEGQGPAAVYRFSEASMRHGLDSGLTSESILAFLSQRSATPLPQPLMYLVEDTALRHGQLKVGQAGSYLRSDHADLLTELLADARTTALGMERLAPTVVVSGASANELIATLRSLGYTTSKVGGAAASLGRTPAPGSARRRPNTSGNAPVPDVRANAWELTDDAAAAQVRTLRGSAAGPSTGAAESDQLLGLETLRKAIRLKRKVRIGVVDRAGNQRQQELVPLSVSGGRVRVFDPARETEHVISIHRVMDVELLDPPGGTPAHG